MFFLKAHINNCQLKVNRHMLLLIITLYNCFWFSYGTNGTVVPYCLPQLDSIHNAHSANYLMVPQLHNE